MPDVVVVDPTKGIPEEHAKQLLRQGFTCIPKVSIRNSPTVARLGEAPVPMQIVDLWVGPQEPQIPQAFVAGVLVSLKREDGDWVTLDSVAKACFGIGIRELEGHVQFVAEPTDDPKDGQGRPDPDVGEGPGGPQAEVLPFPS